MSRTLTILIALLAAQIVVYALVSIDTHKVQKKEQFLSIDTSLVDYIKIRNEDGEMVMKRVGTRWKITEPLEYSANPSYVKTLLEKMAELQVETEVTSNPDKYQTYELDDLAAKYAELGKEGGKIDKFYTGKSSDSYTQTYMRRADSKKVLLVSGSPRSSFSRKPEDWRDKRVLELDRTQVERMLLKFPQETIELTRQIGAGSDTTDGKDTTWLATPSTGASFNPVDKSINRILNALKRLHAVNFLDTGRDTIPDFSTPDFTIEVYLEGNQREVLDFIPKADEDTRWLGRLNRDDKTIYVIYQSSVKNMMQSVDDLKGIEKKEKERGA
ncbi:MAG: DUF4340 domain-containing protein [Calditrichota bacterium]